MPTRARLYVAAVTATAVLTAGLVLPGLDWGSVDPVCFGLLVVFALVLVCTTKLPALGENPVAPALIAVLLCAAILLPGPAAALVGTIGSAGSLIRAVPTAKVLFNMSCSWLCTISACLVYRGLGGTYSLQAQNFPRSFLPIETATVTLSVVAALLIALLPLAVGHSSARVALAAGARLVPHNVAYSFVGLLTAVLWDNGYNVMAALVLIGPLLVTRWATEQYNEQQLAHDATVRTLVQAVEIKDLYTRGHSERVAEASGLIAQQLRMAPDRTAVLRHAAILHDVGKLGVPTRLLRKTGQLDSAEFAAIRLHPTRGVDVVRDIAFLDEAYSAILHHHERMDGKGYPSGLAGAQIPRFARIIAVADAFDSMTSTRSYRGARSVPAALTELRRCAGAQFDPVIVDAMERAVAELARSGQCWLGDGTVPRPDEPDRAVPAPGPGTLAEALADRLAGAGGSPERAELDHDDPDFAVLPARSAGVAGATAGTAGTAGAATAGMAMAERPGRPECLESAGSVGSLDSVDRPDPAGRLEPTDRGEPAALPSGPSAGLVPTQARRRSPTP